MLVNEIGVVAVDQSAVFQSGCVELTRGGLLLIAKVVEAIHVEIAA